MHGKAVRQLKVGDMYKCCVQNDVREEFLTVNFLLWFSRVVRLWQAYRETVATGVSGEPSVGRGIWLKKRSETYEPEHASSQFLSFCKLLTGEA